MGNSIARKLNIIALIITLTYSLLVIIGAFNSCLSFGNGLGDLGMIFMLILLNIIVIVGCYIALRKYNWLKPMAVINGSMALFILVYFTLRLTIWRGPELPWNGHLFYC